jgi:hypothetical protein
LFPDTLSRARMIASNSVVFRFCHVGGEADGEGVLTTKRQVADTGV